MPQRLFDFDSGTHRLLSVPGSVEQYPGGDVAVRNLRPAGDGCTPVYWNSGGTLDYASVAQWAAFHRGYDAEPVLVMPYLPSARGDHDATYDAQGVAQLTAATGVRHLIAADPHSSAWGDSAADWGLTVHAISAASIISTSPLAGMTWDGVIAPDKGAVDRAGEVARMFGVPLRTAGKVRDPKTGKLSGFTAPEGLAGRYLVVDDICDGGGTFAGMAQVLRDTSPDAQIHLWTTHGLFTGRWHENLMPNFASVTAASTHPSPNPVAVPHEITWTALWPNVINELARLHAVQTAACPRTRRDTMSTSNPAKLFTVKEIITREDGDGRPTDHEYCVDLADEMVLFSSEDAASEWMSEQGYRTYRQIREEHQADLIARFNEDQVQYAKDLCEYEKALSRYEADRAEVQKLRAEGVSARVAPNPVKPAVPTTPSTTAPTVSKWWHPERHYEIVPATVIR